MATTIVCNLMVVKAQLSWKTRA